MQTAKKNKIGDEKKAVGAAKCAGEEADVEMDSDDEDSDDDSSVSSSSSEEENEAEKKPKQSKSVIPASLKRSSSSSSSSSSSESSSSEDEKEDKSKGQKKSTPSPKKTKNIAFDGEEKKEEIDLYNDDSTEVSDVEVSDVSSVEDSSSSSSSSSSDSDSSSSDSDSSSDSSSSDDDHDHEAHAQAKKEAAAKKAAEAATAAAMWQPSPANKNGSSTPEIKIVKGTDGAQALSAGKPFSRVDSEHWGDLAIKDGGAMADNSYESVFGYDGFGAKSSEKLLQVRGKRFQHEKTKRKRSFNGFSNRGGQISMASNSTKYAYSDDE